MSFDEIFDLTAGVYFIFYDILEYIFFNNIYLFFFHPPWDGEKKKFYLTTLPRIFIRVVCQFNSVAFAIFRLNPINDGVDC